MEVQHVEDAGRLERGLFLDRDGVINEEVGYLIRPEDMRLVPGIVSLCRTARSLGYRIFVVTNQAGIGRGFHTEAEFHHLMQHMQAELQRDGVVFDAVYYSPYHPEHGIGEYRQDHQDRKPNPGMMLLAAREFGTSLADSILVGDRCTDIAAANAAGLRKAFLLAREESGCAGPHEPVKSLAEVERWLVANG